MYSSLSIFKKTKQKNSSETGFFHLLFRFLFAWILDYIASNIFSWQSGNLASHSSALSAKAMDANAWRSSRSSAGSTSYLRKGKDRYAPLVRFRHKSTGRMDPTRRRQQVKKRGTTAECCLLLSSLSIPFGVVLSSRFLNNIRQLNVKDIPGSRQASHSLLSRLIVRLLPVDIGEIAIIFYRLRLWTVRLLLLFTSFSFSRGIYYKHFCFCLLLLLLLLGGIKPGKRDA